MAENISQQKRVQFAKGASKFYFPDGKYNSSEFDGVVYFAEDECKIYVDGEAYGIGGTVLETLKSNNFVSGVSLTTDGSGKQALKVDYFDKDGVFRTDSTDLFAIQGSDSIVVEHVTKEVGEGDEKTTVVTADYKVSLKLDASDKVLSQSASGLKANVTLGYDTENHKITLTGKNSESLGEVDLTDFTKDRFVESGEVVTITEELEEVSKLNKGDVALKLVLKTYGDEEATTLYIAANDLVKIDTYTEGDAIKFEEDSDNATGTGKKISIQLADDSYLTTTDGLSLDIDAVKTAVEEGLTDSVVESVKEQITAEDLYVSTPSDEEGAETPKTIADALADLVSHDSKQDASIGRLDSSVSGLETSVSDLETAVSALEEYFDEDGEFTVLKGDVDTLEGRVDTIDGSISTLDSSVSGIETILNELDGTKIKVGGSSNIEDGNILTTSTLQEALYNLNTRLNAVAGTEGDVNWDNQTLSTYLSSVMTSAGLDQTGNFVASAYDNTILSNYAPEGGLKTIADAIKAEDAALKDLRVNGVASAWDADNEYLNITLTGADIAIPSDEFTGVLSTETNIQSAFAKVDDSITWHYYTDTTVPTESTDGGEESNS